MCVTVCRPATCRRPPSAYQWVAAALRVAAEPATPELDALAGVAGEQPAVALWGMRPACRGLAGALRPWPARLSAGRERGVASCARVPPVSRASVGVVPEGMLTTRTLALDLLIRTEDQHCDTIEFEGGVGTCDALGVRLRTHGGAQTELAASAAAPGGSSAGALRGLIPEKYNVDIESGGGNVELGRLEGSAVITTVRPYTLLGLLAARALRVAWPTYHWVVCLSWQGGGDIALDKITSAEICLSSGGGAVSARVLQGLVRIDSAGGHMQLQRLVAPTAELDAGSGTVDCRALCTLCFSLSLDCPPVSMALPEADNSGTGCGKL
jgi:hypothetical protein